MIAKRITIAAMGLICMSAACKKDKNNCEDAICTMDFRSVTLQVTDANNNAVVLDEAYTVKINTNDTLRYNEQNNNNNGYYTVLNDSYRANIQNQQHAFMFIGIKNNQRVVNESYTISADCCHISKVSGKESVTVQ